MRYLLATVTGAAALAAVGLAPGLADPVHAPPVLTPAVAARVAGGCPAAAPYAAALVRGATRDEAAAAVPLLAACRAQIRFPEYRWKNDAATLGLAAAELSRGLLDHDAAELKRAADATNGFRSASVASDDQIRAWTAIPDYVNTATGKVLVVNDDGSYCGDPGTLNAAYINLAARTGTAWIATPRTSPTTIERRAAACQTTYENYDRRITVESPANRPYDGLYNQATSPEQTNPALRPEQINPSYFPHDPK